MKAWFQVALLVVGLWSPNALAGLDSFDLGSGRDGPLTVTAAGTVINRHAQVTGPIAPGDNTLLVVGTEGFEAGDLVMVLQVTGLVPEPSPGQPGPVELSHDAVGRWELARLAKVGEGVLTVSSPLLHSYAAQVTQVIRVPEYTHVRIQRGASLRAVPWKGGTGGVVAFLATGTVENEGEITATGAGFRGGRYVPDSSDPVLCSSMAAGTGPGAQKGEGVAVTQYGPTKTGRERVSNGGGGGLCPLAGGGGGGNGGVGGKGGGGGGAGGGAGGGGGGGGAKLGYSLLDHLSLGGGGGSGHGEDWSGPDAGAGGGAIFIRTARLSGGGFIVADGEAGGSSSVGGASGGGAGGSISLRLSGDAVCGGVSARGGRGGDATGLMSRGGEGGGGGGGRVLFRAGGASECPVFVAAGSNGARAISPSALVAQPAVGVIEEPVAGFGLAANSVVITSPANGSTVSNALGPRIELCVTDGNGQCTGGLYKYELFINNVKKTEVTAGSPWTYTPNPHLGGNTYTVYVRATVLSTGGGTPTVYESSSTFTVDATEPDTYIGDPKPPAATLSRSASFVFSSDESGAKFECALDAPGEPNYQPFTACTSPMPYTGLQPGSHTFSVRAIDAVGNVDKLPATHSWTIVLLNTVISSAPDPNSNSSSARFEFSAVGGVRYECSLDAPGTSRPFTTCSSPKEYTGLQEGSHTFSVRAIDAAGNVEAEPSTYTWVVDTVPPPDTTISLAPPLNTQSTSATFEFSAVGNVTYECMLNAPGTSNDKSFAKCNSPKGYDNLQEGSHTFFVRAVDSANNKGNPARYDWNIDTTPPRVSVLNPANGDLVSTRLPIIIGTVNDPFSTVQVFIDNALVGQARADKDGLWSLSTTMALNNGPHTVYAKATNPVGIVGAPSGSNSFTVDTEPPDTVIISLPPKVSNSRLAAFEFGSPSGATEFECRLDAAPAFTSCGPTPVFTKLSDGEHTLQVRARDSAGNVDPIPEIYQWTVVIRPPLFPEVLEPVDAAIVDTGTPVISGRAEPRNTVTIYIDGQKSGVAQADDSGDWTFRPSTPLAEGEHSLTTEATDEAGNTSAQHSEKRVFSVLIPKGNARAIGGGLSCASSGGASPPAWLLLGSGLWLLRRRRRC